MTRAAPWPDARGDPIREGDTVVHSYGERGVVVFLPDFDHWFIEYVTGCMVRLERVIGDDGRAVVTVLRTAPATAPE